MNFRGKGRSREHPAIDLTPMLDVTFNLLLFFVVTTNFRQQDDRHPGIQVDLPRSSAQTILSDDEDIDVWMKVDGSLYVDEKPVDLATLRQIFRERAQVDPTTLVVIKADTGVSHGRVVTVMDLAKAFGLSRLAIATQPRTDGE